MATYAMLEVCMCIVWKDVIMFTKFYLMPTTSLLLSAKACSHYENNNELIAFTLNTH